MIRYVIGHVIKRGLARRLTTILEPFFTCAVPGYSLKALKYSSTSLLEPFSACYVASAINGDSSTLSLNLKPGDTRGAFKCPE